MMTTDTFPKLATRTREIAGSKITVSGAAKGAAMIAPNMATMLAVIMTDAPIGSQRAGAALRHSVDRSFNCISVDGHMSTSDSVLLLAANTREIGLLGSADHVQIQEMIDEVAADLAQAVIRDAEGASHFVTLDVRGLRSREEAYRIAKAIADSPLVKTAIAGGDPNWGRIISAAGYAGVQFREEDATLRVNGALLYKSGAPVEFDAKAVAHSMRGNREMLIELDFSIGGESIRFWTSDLTAEYVRLNADYTT
jgi:glutamate N-acetyltransferase/amino-acid N-acetyltransferase